MIAQVGLQKLRGLLDDGDDQVLARVRLSEQYTVAETLKFLSLASPLAILTLLNKIRAKEIYSQAAKVSAELDFVQAVLDLVAAKDSLNPSLNAMVEAFRRRLISNSFISGGHSIQLDSLVYADTSSHTDFDHCATDMRSHRASRKKLAPLDRQRTTCIDFQRGDCRWRNCRFDHRCSMCGKWGHGQMDCWQMNAGSSITKARKDRRLTDRRRDPSPSADVPPHPRRRTDRKDKK